MKRYREWTATLPAAGQFVVLALVVAAVVLVLTAVRGHPSLVTALVVGAIVSALLTPVAIARRSALGRIRLIVEVSAAIKTGLVPEVFDEPRWVAQLASRRVWALRLVAAGVIMMLAGAGFALWAVWMPDRRLEHGLSACLSGAGGVWLVVSSLLLLPRIRRVRVEIERGHRVVLGG